MIELAYIRETNQSDDSGPVVSITFTIADDCTTAELVRNMKYFAFALGHSPSNVEAAFRGDYD